MNGTVKFFNGTKGFGFIAGEDSKEYFVHKTGLAEGTSLNENDAVTFDVEEGEKGPKAVNVQKAGSAEAATPNEENGDSEQTDAQKANEAETSDEEEKEPANV